MGKKKGKQHQQRQQQYWLQQKKHSCNAAPACFADKKRFTVLYKTRSVYRYFSDLYSPPQLQTLLVADLAEKDNITISTAAAEIYFHFHTRYVFASVSVPVCMHILSWRVRDRSHRVHRLFTSLRASSLSCSYIHFHPSKYVISGIRIDKS